MSDAYPSSPTLVQLVALDFDGTCADYTDGLAVAPPVLAALADYAEKGIGWAFNTDRPLEQMSALALTLPCTLRPQALLLRQRTIHLLNHEAYHPLEEWNRTTGKAHTALWEQIHPFFESWQREIDDNFLVRHRYVDHETFAFMVDPDESPALRESLEGLVQPWPEAKVSGNTEWSFVLHTSFSKGRLLAAAAEALQISPTSILAVGDGFNDLTMLDGTVTSLVGCPANSCEEVKTAVRHAGGIVSRQPEALGTAAILRSYLD